MKPHRRIILVSILAGFGIWLLDSLVDYVFFFELSFLEVFITRIPPHEVYMRLLTLFSLLAVGLLGRWYMIRVQKSEGALQESTALLRELMDNSLGAMCIKSRDGKFLHVNRMFERLHGVRREDICGSTTYDLYAKDTADSIAETERQVMESGKPLQYEEEVAHADGSVHTYSISKFPLRESSATVTRVGEISIDVTERKRAETALRETTERLLRAQAVAHLGSWELDLETNTSRWSDEAYRIIGREPQETPAGYETFLNLVHPDDRGRVNRAYTESLANKTSYEIDHRIVRPDGEIRHLHVRCENICNKEGKVIRSVGTALDVTERRQAEEEATRLHTAIEQTGEAVIITDPDANIVYVNPAFERITGYARDEVIGENPRILQSGAQDATFYRNMWETLLRDEVWTGEFINKRRDGTHFSEQATISPMRSPDGELLGYVAAKTDITERKKVEEQLLAYQEQLRVLVAESSLAEQRERRRLADELHDLVAQPLAFAKLKLGALSQTRLSRDAEGIRSQIDEQIDEAIRSTRSLTSELSPTILYEMGFEDAIEWMCEQTSTRHHFPTSFRRDNEPHPLPEDTQVTLYQAVRELLINAVKHSKAKGASVTLRRKGERIEIEVKDSGVGFDTSLSGQSDPAKHGFGLFSIHDRLDLLGGDMEIRSAKGKGTRVTLRAPLQDPVTQTGETSEQDQNPARR